MTAELGIQDGDEEVVTSAHNQVVQAGDEDQVSEKEMAEEQRTMEVNRLIAEAATISEDIDDFLDENEVDEIGGSIDDYDMINKDIESLRSTYRSIHNKLKSAMEDGAYDAKYID